MWRYGGRAVIDGIFPSVSGESVVRDSPVGSLGESRGFSSLARLRWLLYRVTLATTSIVWFVAHAETTCCSPQEFCRFQDKLGGHLINSLLCYIHLLALVILSSRSSDL
jgi:hypothetical protein